MNETTNTAVEKQKTPQGKAWQGAFKAFSVAFDGIKQNPAPALLFVGVYTLLAVISGPSESGVPYTNEKQMSFENLAYLIFLLALPVYSLAVADGKQITVGEAMRFNFFKYVSLLAVGILFVLIVGFSALLLIVPAIWTIAWFALAGYAVPDKGLGPIAALKESKRLSSKHKSKVWGIIGVSLLVGIVAGLIGFIPVVGAIAVGAASLWAAVASAVLYRWLQKQALAK